MLQIDDRFLDRGGVYALDVIDGVGRCEPTTASPHVKLDIAELGGLYLGGRSAHTMARAAKLTATEASVRRLDDLLRTARAPYCIEVF